MPGYYMCGIEGCKHRDLLQILADSPDQAAVEFRQIFDARMCEYPPERRIVVGLMGQQEIFIVALESAPIYSAKKDKSCQG
jgi:hypothetical protein